MKAKIKLNDYKFNNIKISGSKNSSLPIIAASILCDEQVILHNIPNISDIIYLIKILNNMGFNLKYQNNTLIVNPSNIDQCFFNDKLIDKLRGSYYIIGSLISKFEYCNFSFLSPGGCKLGNRPINYHIDAFKNMGLQIIHNKNKIDIKGIKTNTTHNLLYPSVGTTINIILASCKIENKTIINNASIEPEVIDLCNFLKSMGVIIKIHNRTISIIGKKHFKKSMYTVMEDRIEASTYLILGAIHNGICISNINIDNLYPLITLFKNIGFKLLIEKNKLTIYKQSNLKPFDIYLDPHPGLCTDLNPLLCVLASQINGTSTITDNVFKQRTKHVKELQKLGIDLSFNDNVITIKGKANINSNNHLKSHDLRCGAALILAASLNGNYSYINNIETVFRGYENLQHKLNSLGINFII